MAPLSSPVRYMCSSIFRNSYARRAAAWDVMRNFTCFT
jgi:hypothetical protein